MIFLVVQGCKLADLRTETFKKEGVTIDNSEKGKVLIEKAWKAQGFDKLKTHTVYSYEAIDTWKGLLGKAGKIWPESKSVMSFKYRVGSFDGQVEFKNRKDDVKYAGLQNWNYYEINERDTIFKDLTSKKNEKTVFGISAFQYFTEMIDRLKNAPIIIYQGENEFRGQYYDLVLCTWETTDPHLEHDQYVVWINKETGLMDFTEYTIRETYLKPPGYKSISGAVEYADFKEIDGILIPHTQLVYAMKLNENQNKNLHKLIISDFKFDSFNQELLQIDKTLKLGGDFK